MISIPLLKREVKSNYKLFIIFAAVLTMYISVIIPMFDPEIGEALAEFEKAIPEMMAAFGMSNPGATLIEFINTYLFGFLFIIFPMIFEIIIANKLIAKYVDSGSMAYLLATPNKKSKIAITQALFMLISIGILIFFITLVGIISSEVNFPGELDIKKYILMNIGLYCLHISISGLAFFASCISNDTKLSYSISAGVPIGFFIIQLLANMGGKLENFKYFTIFTLLDTDKLIKGNVSAIWMIIVLLVVGIILYIAGILRFNKRDLPL
ncbi:ABC transporter permease subunit [Clostridium sp. AL.422]|uniref:ABC transporter permease subunit n=1 Tax=Clostridium TaxID=1485 RepID=UPI00293DAAEC|nr:MULTISPECIES: ABC transporter permease subunit [unclassified Clostridium]MDV4149412.1 ABC transporter permease subunit [Clostridium sp. AL.422]